MQNIFLKPIFALFIALLFTACTSSPKQSLYDDLGQYQGIDNIVRELIFIIAKDERVKARYKGVNMQHFKKGLSDYICQVSGGPCQYANENMRQVHAGHNYTNTEFNAIVDNLILAMERREIPVTTQNRLLAILARDYKDVVHQ
ncbi:group 1 truncated hemoglobin [Cellvibrio sp. UBA7661]|uniref:group I truncated hemoglobin n=1 Tax=Cellvibrio sp. UBA7661 TaxID=1946311 RepID=UPI002F359810